MRNRPVRTFIVGSCVSRDTFAVLPSEDFCLRRYVARQSLISIDRPVAAGAVAYQKLPSKFQRTMLAGDLAGDAIDQLSSAGEIDLVLWDLTDERLGVHPVGGGFYTRTIEGLRAGLYRDGIDHIAFGTDRHFELWSAALPRWLTALDDRGLLPRTLFLQVPWAALTSDGEDTPESFGLTAPQANAASFRYQRALMDAAPIEMIRPRCAVRAEPEHRWGLAAFHYTDEVYDDLIAQITAFCR